MRGPDESRSDTTDYPRRGRFGPRLPRISLGLRQTFGGGDVFDTGRALARRAFDRGAFDRGVTHLDLANNHGPPYGSAEETFGRILAADLALAQFDELLDATKNTAFSTAELHAIDSLTRAV